MQQHHGAVISFSGLGTGISILGQVERMEMLDLTILLCMEECRV
jgi:hypothetical protein